MRFDCSLYSHPHWKLLSFAWKWMYSCYTLFFVFRVSIFCYRESAIEKLVKKDLWRRHPQDKSPNPCLDSKIRTKASCGHDLVRNSDNGSYGAVCGKKKNMLNMWQKKCPRMNAHQIINDTWYLLGLTFQDVLSTPHRNYWLALCALLHIKMSPVPLLHPTVRNTQEVNFSADEIYN